MGRSAPSDVHPYFVSLTDLARDMRAGTVAVFATGVADAITPEGGVIPAAVGSLAVTSTGTTSSPQVSVAPGRCVIPVTNQYAYVCTTSSALTVNLTAPPSTNPRSDLIVAAVHGGSELSDSLSGLYAESIDGAPSGSPVTPTAPNGTISLAAARVNTNGSVVITDLRAYTRATGGVRRSINDGGRGGSHQADLRISDTGVMDFWDTNKWTTIASPPAWSQFTPTLLYAGAGATPAGTANLGSPGAIAICRYRLVGKTLDLSYYFHWGTSGYSGGVGYLYTTLPAGLTGVARTQWMGAHLWVNTAASQANWQGQTLLLSGDSKLQPWFSLTSTDTRMGQYTVSNPSATPGSGIPQITGGYPEGGELTITGTIEVT